MLKKLITKIRKNERIPAIETKKVVSTDYMQVIEAAEIIDMEIPLFHQGKWGSEDEYRVYLESVQFLIEKYEHMGAIHTLRYDMFSDILKNREEQLMINNFKASFMEAEHWVNVEKTIEGKYRVVSNGRHRMYVAHKYGLKLLVHVSQEVRIETATS